jgi:23S rRNA (pseudouridine1915-N3)-methyltransferase
MHIKVVTIGTKMPAWVDSGVAEYQKRLPREWRFEWKMLPLGQRSKSQSVSKVIEDEGDAILSVIDEKDYVVALEVKGKAWSTEGLAKEMARWQMDALNIVLLIGGPDGLSRRCLERAQQKWSLSALTLPHPLVRVLLTEQLYRAWTLLNNHPYHK